MRNQSSIVWTVKGTVVRNSGGGGSHLQGWIYHARQGRPEQVTGARGRHQTLTQAQSAAGMFFLSLHLQELWSLFTYHTTPTCYRYNLSQGGLLYHVNRAGKFWNAKNTLKIEQMKFINILSHQYYLAHWGRGRGCSWAVWAGGSLLFLFPSKVEHMP